MKLIKSGDVCKASCSEKTCSLVAFQYEAYESISGCTVSAEILTQKDNLKAMRLAPGRLIIRENEV